MVLGHLVVAVVLHALGLVAEVFPADREHNIDQPLAWDLMELLAVGQVLLYGGVLGRLLQDGPDAAVLVLWDVEVLHLAAVDVLLLAADDVCTQGLGQQEVLTF